MYISVKNTIRTKANVRQMFCSFNIKNYTPCKAPVITEKCLPLWILFPFLFTLVLVPEDWKQNYRPLWRDPILTTFLGPILLNQQMWITGMTLTSTRTFSCLVASRAFRDLLSISEKSCTSLITGPLCSQLDVEGIIHLLPLLGQPGRGSRALPTAAASAPCQPPWGHKCVEMSCMEGDLAAESTGLGATWDKPHGTLQAIRYSSKDPGVQK